MQIKKLISSLNTFSGIASNSKDVRDNYIFVAIKGSRQDGNIYIKEAIARGARAIVCNSRSTVHRDKGVAFIPVADTRKASAELASLFFKEPSKKMKIVGVTGTNGKTTVTYLIEALLKQIGAPCAVVGTVNYRFKGKVLPSTNTTPGPIQMQGLLADMRKAGVGFAVLEVSSHALDQDRTAGIKFSSAIFTNLTQDHLDYHKTLEKYFRSKALLFRGLAKSSFAVINNDDKYAVRLKRLTRCKIITYGIKNKSDIIAKDIRSDISGTRFQLTHKGKGYLFKTPLIGRHNVYNILAAVAWAMGAGLKASDIKPAIKNFRLVPGRLEKVENKSNFSVFVDYAHTEDALKNILTSLRPLSKKEIIVVFGCGGERDKLKRPKMGRIVSELADFAIITNDNPRSEDPQEIIRQIKRGIKKNNYCVIPDRLEAIKKSLSMASRGDIVLLAGKGHENYQVLKDRTVHFDDREAVKRCLRSLNY